MHRIKIILLGDSGVGKSSLLYCYQFQNCLRDSPHFQHYYTTIGVDFYNRDECVDGNWLKLQIWDTSGQERFRSITESYYRGCQVVIIMCSDISINSFKNTHRWLENFKNHNNEDHAMIYLVLNRHHTKASPRNDLVSFENLVKYGIETDAKIKVMEISCWDGNGVDKLFQDIKTSYLQSCKGEVQDTNSNDSINLNLSKKRCNLCSII